MLILNSVLLLILLAPKYSSGTEKSPNCSDEVPLNDNINGKITIEPGDTVLPGTNYTINCAGINGERRDGEKSHNPEDYNIIVINIFRGGDIIHTCSHQLNILKCSVHLTGIKELGLSQFTCRFRTRSDKFFCFISKRLTVTDNACLVSPSPCHNNATCTNTSDSYNCTCNKGFSGNGTHCQARKLCSSQSPCHKDANCFDLPGWYNCSCKAGFTGNGTHCEKIQWCSTHSPCHKDANCIELSTSYNCTCKPGFSGNGTHCERNNDCSSLPAKCDKNAYCAALECKCNDGFTGNGTFCLEIVRSGVGGGEASSLDEKWLIVGLAGAFLITAGILTILLYKKRKQSREDTLRKTSQMNQRRGTAIENLGILFPMEDKKDIQNSPIRKLPSIKDHNIEGHLDEDVLTYICVLDDWEIELNNLAILQKRLGGGQFGVVKKGLYREKASEKDEIPVAVKMLKDVASTSDRSDLLMELHILKEVNKEPHPNVIKLIGAYTSEDPILVITEYCSRGNLKSVLRNSRINDDNNRSPETYINVFSKLSHRILLKIAIDIANGMKHLAAHQFVHRDLSARNVLITSDYEAKVSDFGLARPITGVDQMYLKSNRNLLPVKWMALESLTHGVFRTSSDIWAFGILLWEITTLGDEPYPGISPYDILNFLASGDRMDRPPQCSEELYDIMLKCWEANQEDRPTFPKIHDQLTEMFEDKQQIPYINVVEVSEKTIENLDDRRESVQSLRELERYTKA